MNVDIECGTAHRAVVKKLVIAPTSSSIGEARDDRCLANVDKSASGGSSSLERALVAMDRDSDLRRKFLRKRWQGAIGITSARRVRTSG
jgi:hypothetical protein